MKKFYAIAGIIAGVLLLVGGALVGIGIVSGADKDFKLFGKLDMSFGGSELVVQEYKELAEFDSIDIEANLASVEIAASDNDKYGIEYKLYSDNVKCDVQADSLIFREDKGKFGINFDFGYLFRSEDTYVKIYVPEKELKSIEISADMGNITVNNVKCDYLYADCDMGTIELNAISAKDVELDADVGSVFLTGTVTGAITADLDMGNAKLTGWLDCDIDMSCDMGDVYIVTYYDSSAYRLDIEAEIGDEKINNDGGEKISSDNTINVDCDMGSIEITFKDVP